METYHFFQENAGEKSGSFAIWYQAEWLTRLLGRQVQLCSPAVILCENIKALAHEQKFWVSAFGHIVGANGFARDWLSFCDQWRETLTALAGRVFALIGMIKAQFLYNFRIIIPFVIKITTKNHSFRSGFYRISRLTEGDSSDVALRMTSFLSS